MAFFAQLQSKLKSRKDYVDAASTISTGQGEGIRIADSAAPGGHRFYSFRDFQDASATGYCGLRNQRAACYLNSMLSALYLTHSFRRAVYRWQPDPNIHPPVPQCPAAQLQRLCLRACSSQIALLSPRCLSPSHSGGMTISVRSAGCSRNDVHTSDEHGRIWIKRVHTR